MKYFVLHSSVVYSGVAVDKYFKPYKVLPLPQLC